MSRTWIRGIGSGFATFVVIFGAAAVLINVAPALYPRGTGWGALLIASVPWFAAGYTAGRFSEEKRIGHRALLGAVLGALIITAVLAWPHFGDAHSQRHLLLGMYLASVVICAGAAALGTPRANKTMEPTR